MATKLVITKDGPKEVPLTEEEEAQRVIDQQRAVDRASERDLEIARRQAILDQMKVWDDRLRGKTLAELVSLFQGADAAQKDELLLYLALTRALELK